MHEVLKQLSPDKVVAIQFILASSINFDDMFDNIHIPGDVDHLIAERIAYVKNQEVENLADENSSSQNDVNHELIDFFKDEKDTDLTQDSQEDFDFIDGVDVSIGLIEGKVDNYSTEYPIRYASGEVDYHSIDKGETAELQDVPIEVTNEQEIEECIEEVVSDMTLPEGYRVEMKIHTDVKLEIPIIKSEEPCVMRSELKQKKHV